MPDTPVDVTQDDIEIDDPPFTDAAPTDTETEPSDFPLSSSSRMNTPEEEEYVPQLLRNSKPPKKKARKSERVKKRQTGGK